MTDSLTQSDIDRIYGRIQEQIDLAKIRTKQQFSKAIKDNPRTKKWNRELNDFFWDIHTKAQPVVEEIEEIETIPVPPREKLTPIQKRKETARIKKITIDIKASSKQRAYTRRIGRIWVDSEIKFAQRLRKDGLTHKQVAEQLKRTESSVSTKLGRLRRMKGGKK